MAIIYNNIPAPGAPVVARSLTGCENQILFRADQWGTTNVEVRSYSANDAGTKTATLFTVGGSNQNFCLPCTSLGEVYEFSVLNGDPVTAELFVEILEPGCCCGSASTECFEIPIKFVPCS